MKCRQFTALIDAYLTGELAGELKEQIEEHYFRCDRCYTELKLRESLVHKNVQIYLRGREKKPFLMFKPVLALASLLIVVVSSLLIIQQHRQSRLLREISAFTPPTYHRSETRSAAADDRFDRAMTYYTRQDYKKTLDLLKEIKIDADNPQIIFFTGITYLLNDKYKKAVGRFDAILEMMNPAYFDEAAYYRAIALLRLNKREAALEELKHLATMFSPYAPRASALIKKIEKIL
jgi:tetratricopeptide (TPR) repeat protein